MMKIALYIAVADIYGGAERRLIRIIKEMSKKSNDFHIILKGNSYNIDNLINNELKSSNVNIIRCKNSLSVLKHIIKTRYNKIWFFNVDKCILMFIIPCKIIRTKLVMTVANYYFSIYDFERRGVRTAFNFVAKHSNYIDCLYEDGVEKLKKKIKNKIITQTPTPFTNSEVFAPKIKQRQIVFASRLIKIKNPMLFLESVNVIKKELLSRDYKVIFCGDGPLKDDAVRYIEENKLEDLVQWKGFINMHDVLPYSKIFISLQSLENYPSQSLLEAISSGNFVVVSDVGNSYRLVMKEFGNLTKLNKNDIATRIIEAIDYTESNSQKVICSARQFSEKKFNIKNSICYFEKIFFNSK